MRRIRGCFGATHERVPLTLEIALKHWRYGYGRRLEHGTHPRREQMAKAVRGLVAIMLAWDQQAVRAHVWLTHPPCRTTCVTVRSCLLRLPAARLLVILAATSPKEAVMSMQNGNRASP